ncbi:hypothetical protein EPO44_11985 [bacterium]|nr:MAG: hypothetical protein EPO44_11985 [bacterium]
MATIEATRLKLAEAEFFYRKLAEAHGRLVSGEPEAFGFYLSAFLSAARSVTLVLQAERKAQYDMWFVGWKDALPEEQQNLLRHFNQQRVATIHQKGAAVTSKLEEISSSEFFLAVAKEGTQIQVWRGVPGTPAAPQYRTERSLVFNDTKVNAVHACGQYVALLSQLISSFAERFPDEPAT